MFLAMKKIFTIASLFAAGTALANAATVVDNIPASGIVYEWLFNGSSTPTIGSGWSANFGYNEDGYGILNGRNSDKQTPWISNPRFSAGSFSISMDVSSFSIDAWSDLISMKDSSGNAFQVQATNSSTLAFYVNSGFGGASDSTELNNVESSDIYEALTSSEWNTLTFTSDGTTFAAYIDGSLILSKNFGVSGSLNGFQFGALFAPSDSNNRNYVNGNVDNVVIWNRALSADEVKSLVTPIPEPSAFGLLASVGALALVATRRRRKNA